MKRADLERDLRRSGERGKAALVRQLAQARTNLDRSRQQLERRAPARLIDEQRRRVDDIAARGTRAMGTFVALARSRAHARESQLSALSPLTTLSRGYAIATSLPGGAVLMDATQVSPGERLAVRLARGRLVGEVTEREAPAESESPRDARVER